MDSTTIVIVIALVALLFIGVGILWILKRGRGTFAGLAEGPLGRLGFKVTTDEPPTPPRPRQRQVDSEDVSQEMPASSGGKQEQIRTKHGKQKQIRTKHGKQKMT